MKLNYLIGTVGYFCIVFVVILFISNSISISISLVFVFAEPNNDNCDYAEPNCMKDYPSDKDPYWNKSKDNSNLAGQNTRPDNESDSGK